MTHQWKSLFLPPWPVLPPVLLLGLLLGLAPAGPLGAADFDRQRQRLIRGNRSDPLG